MDNRCETLPSLKGLFSDLRRCSPCTTSVSECKMGPGGSRSHRVGWQCLCYAFNSKHLQED